LTSQIQVAKFADNGRDMYSMYIRLKQLWITCTLLDTVAVRFLHLLYCWSSLAVC